MGQINNKFFQDLEDKATWSAGIAFKRSNPLPLDRYSVFATYNDAIAYITEQPTIAYPGQLISVVEDNKIIAYIVKENNEGSGLELKEINNTWGSF